MKCHRKVVSRKHSAIFQNTYTKIILGSFAIMLAGGAVVPLSSHAQSSSNMPQAISNPVPEANSSIEHENAPKIVFPRQKYSSVLFTYWEHSALEDSREARGHVRPPTMSELKKELQKPSAPEPLKIKPPPEERELYLSGIVYHSPKNWSIWLNGKYITPKALPKEILELNVYKTYIEFKWFDDYSNQIYPIRLRPHQRFNIDTRIFLPG